MKKKININLVNFVKIMYTKMNIANVYINLYKFKSNISLIYKFVLLLMVIFSNTTEFTSIWDLGDLALKMVEQEVKNVKVEDVVEVDTSMISKDEKKEEEEIDFDKMDMDEWFEYLRKHEPIAYWFWICAFAGTSIFCVWLMHYLIGPPRN